MIWKLNELLKVTRLVNKHMSIEGGVHPGGGWGMELFYYVPGFYSLNVLTVKRLFYMKYT